MLLTDIVIDGIPEIDWTLHIPSMLHILFLGLDHTRPIVRDHCKQLLLNLLIVLAEHNDYLNVAKILLNAHASKRNLGLVIPQIIVSLHNFTGKSIYFRFSYSKFININSCGFQNLIQNSIVIYIVQIRVE